MSEWDGKYDWNGIDLGKDWHKILENDPRRVEVDGEIPLGEIVGVVIFAVLSYAVLTASYLISF